MSNQSEKENDEFTEKWLCRKFELEHIQSSYKNLELSLADVIDKLVKSKPGKVIVQRFDYALTREDFIRLDWNSYDITAWLDDNIINCFMEMMTQRSRENSQLPKVYAFNTYLAEKFKSDNFSYQTVYKWTTRAKINLFEMDKVFIPVNNDKHWTLIIIHNDRKRIKWYNSLPHYYNEKTHEEKFKILYRAQEYIFMEHLDKIGQPFDETGWDFELGKEPCQTNSTDCGVFICTYADLIATR